MRSQILGNRSQKGQSLVEFAIGLFFLLLLISGIVDLGRAIFTYMDLREAAQEGAAYATVNPYDTTGIANRVTDSSNVFDSADLSVNVNIDPNPCLGDDITVGVSMANFPLTMPFMGAILGTQTLTITASIKDTVLVPLCP